MDIRSARVRYLELPLNRTYEISDGTSSKIDVILVTLVTADGTRGVGTAEPALGHSIPQSPSEIYTSLRKYILPEILENNPSNPNELYYDLKKFTGKQNARCAVELAYIDAYCRQRDQSLADFLGGAIRDKEPLNGWVGIDTPENMVSETERLYNAGFRSIKAKLSGNIDYDLKRVKAICESFGDRIQIRLDANEGYAEAATAIKCAKRMEQYPIAHFEQPTSRNSLEDLSRVTGSTAIDIMADEPILTAEDGFRYIKADSADRLKFKILQAGGVLEAQWGLDVAAATETQCVVGHGFCSAPSALAEVQLTATHENVFRPIETVGTRKIAEEPFTIRPDMSGGEVAVSNKPGIGTKLDDTAVGHYSTKSKLIE